MNEEQKEEKVWTYEETCDLFERSDNIVESFNEIRRDVNFPDWDDAENQILSQNDTLSSLQLPDVSTIVMGNVTRDTSFRLKSPKFVDEEQLKCMYASLIFHFAFYNITINLQANENDKLKRAAGKIVFGWMSCIKNEDICLLEKIMDDVADELEKQNVKIIRSEEMMKVGREELKETERKNQEIERKIREEMQRETDDECLIDDEELELLDDLKKIFREEIKPQEELVEYTLEEQPDKTKIIQDQDLWKKIEVQEVMKEAKKLRSSTRFRFEGEEVLGVEDLLKKFTRVSTEIEIRKALLKRRKRRMKFKENLKKIN
jgi:hypothetical protein